MRCLGCASTEPPPTTHAFRRCQGIACQHVVKREELLLFVSFRAATHPCVTGGKRCSRLVYTRSPTSLLPKQLSFNRAFVCRSLVSTSRQAYVDSAYRLFDLGNGFLPVFRHVDEAICISVAI